MKNYHNEGFKPVIDLTLFDRLYTLSTEYSIPLDLLVNIAVKRFIDEVDFFRNLRIGKLD